MPFLTWTIVALATAGVILRPGKLPEAIWACAGAALLVLAGLLPAREAWGGILRGMDVYLFLVGMMLLAETARVLGLFDWLAAWAVRRARGSATRLFLLVYLVGTVVTVLLSNDATAVVLTPAVAEAARRARAEKPLPHLLICAFVANAASFVLPISNPANLVIYGSAMPPLPVWLARFTLPSLLAILATFAVLRLTQRAALAAPIAADIDQPALGRGGAVAAAGVGATALVLMAASAMGWDLGLPTCLAGIATTALALAVARASPWPVLRDVSWAVIPLVAGLFVLVAALEHTGVITLLADALRAAPAPRWLAGVTTALAANLTNNLPAGLIAASAVHEAGSPPDVVAAVLIGIDIGPNLSVTGSLATILWLGVLRRENITVSAARFLRLGMLVMPPALLLALAALALG